jgi:hypothetical protein
MDALSQSPYSRACTTSPSLPWRGAGPQQPRDLKNPQLQRRRSGEGGHGTSTKLSRRPPSMKHSRCCLVSCRYGMIPTVFFVLAAFASGTISNTPAGKCDTATVLRRSSSLRQSICSQTLLKHRRPLNVGEGLSLPASTKLTVGVPWGILRRS